MIFLFREFITDIYHQLQSNQTKSPLRVYRSQLMSSDELNSLKQHNGQLISVNSFFSTSNERTTALFLLGDTNSPIDLERVLFEIDADPKVVTKKTFSDISTLSEFTIESEVIFMTGSIFHLENINRNDDGVWIIKMTLNGDEEHDLIKVLLQMKRQMGNGEVNLRILGKILWDMGEFDLAEKYFNRLLKQLKPNDQLHILLYEDLAQLESHRHNFEVNVEWRQKLVEFEQQHQLTNDDNISRIRNHVGKFIEEKESIMFNYIYVLHV